MKDSYKLVIVLCPSEANINNGKYSYFDLENDKREDKKIYLGGNIRMQAAIDIAEKVQYFVVVGGSKSKVDSMKSFFVQEFEKKKITNYPEIIRVESEADTLGNMRAIKKAITNFEGNIGLLTNFYHLPRAMRIASMVNPQLTLIPLSAEAVKSSYDSSYPFFVNEILFRVYREISGLNDLEMGIYNNQDNNKEISWKSICYDHELLKKLNEK